MVLVQKDTSESAPPRSSNTTPPIRLLAFAGCQCQRGSGSGRRLSRPGPA